MPVALVGGYAHSGKDAFVDGLENCGDYCRTFMSKPLMNALLTLDPVIEVENPYNMQLFAREPNVRYSALHALLGYTESKDEPEVRRLLQVLGTEIGRNMFGDDVWVNMIFEELFEADKPYGAVTGVRFANEMSTLKSNFETTSVWIHRPGIVPINSHSSDNSLGPDDFDIIIENTGTLADLVSASKTFHDTYMITTDTK